MAFLSHSNLYQNYLSTDLMGVPFKPLPKKISTDLMGDIWYRFEWWSHAKMKKKKNPTKIAKNPTKIFESPFSN